MAWRFYNSSGEFKQSGSGGSTTLDGLSDVTITSVADTEVLTYDSGTGQWINSAASGGGASAINNLTDVTITTPADNEVLAYDNGTSEWINQTATEAGLAAASHTHTESEITDLGLYLEDITAEPLADLSDVVITSVSDGQVLTYDSGTGNWINEASAGGGGSGREVLTAARTYYVRTDGSDSNDGLSDTAGGAFLTIQKAVDTAASLDLSLYDVTIQVGNGTYTTGAQLKRIVSGGGIIIIEGDTTTPSNVVISTTSSNCFYYTAAIDSAYEIRGFKVQTTTGGSGFHLGNPGYIKINNIEFGACASYHIRADQGSVLQGAGGTFTVSGGALSHLLSVTNAVVNMFGCTLTFSGTPAFSTTITTITGSMVTYSTASISGAATGIRYSVTKNSLVDTNGGGANFFPGDAAGSTATGGQYV